jgi:DNA-binding NarL/FixJ family response regulator
MPTQQRTVLRIAIVEDDPRYRASLEELFAQTPGFQLAGSFACPPPSIAAAQHNVPEGGRPWDIVLLDLEMPQMDGIEATRRLKRLHPDLKVVVLTVFEDPAAILQAVSAGADGYLLKKARARELIEGLRAVADGGAPLTAEVARKVLDVLRTLNTMPVAAGPGSPTRVDLTEREQDVLRALVDGFSYKGAGDKLGISLGTVRSHVASIYRKLQVHNVAEAVSRAVRQRMV